MNPSEILRIVDAIHRDKRIAKEIVFEGIEDAIATAVRKHYGNEEDIEVAINRETGEIVGSHNGQPIDTDEMAERIGAQTAKQVIIQKIREAERDAIFREYQELEGQMLTGAVQKVLSKRPADKGATVIISLDNIDAILPRGEQLPTDRFRIGDRVRFTIYEVRKEKGRVKIVLSRTKSHFVMRLFEQEVPEIAEGIIELKAVAREPGYRAKVAVHCDDQRIDAIGACVGIRGTRIKSITEELGGGRGEGERIDIVKYDEDMQVFIPNVLKPAEIEEVILCQMLGKAIAVVDESQLSLAIGRHGQNVRLASKLCGWDIEIMTREELEQSVTQAVEGFLTIEGVTDEVVDYLVGEGFLTYEELSTIEPEDLAEMGGYTLEEVDSIVGQAELKADEAERQARVRREYEKELRHQGMSGADAAAQARQELEAAKGVATGEEAPKDEAAVVQEDESVALKEEGEAKTQENEATEEEGGAAAEQ